MQRWQTLARKKAIRDGDGRTFEEIAAERQKEALIARCRHEMRTRKSSFGPAKPIFFPTVPGGGPASDNVEGG